MRTDVGSGLACADQAKVPPAAIGLAIFGASKPWKGLVLSAQVGVIHIRAPNVQAHFQFWRFRELARQRVLVSTAQQKGPAAFADGANGSTFNQ
jgi:hypothetical protein